MRRQAFSRPTAPADPITPPPRSPARPGGRPRLRSRLLACRPAGPRRSVPRQFENLPRSDGVRRQAVEGGDVGDRRRGVRRPLDAFGDGPQGVARLDDDARVSGRIRRRGRTHQRPDDEARDRQGHGHQRGARPSDRGGNGARPAAPTALAGAPHALTADAPFRIRARGGAAGTARSAGRSALEKKTSSPATSNSPTISRRPCDPGRPAEPKTAALPTVEGTVLMSPPRTGVLRICVPHDTRFEPRIPASLFDSITEQMFAREDASHYPWGRVGRWPPERRKEPEGRAA